MNLIKFRVDYVVFGGFGFFLIVSMLTSDFQDPTVFNQLYPSLGVKNWTGLIGALIGGSLLEIFGPSILLFPWLFIRIALHHPRKFSLFTAYYYAFTIIFLLSIFYEIAINSGIIKINESDFLWQNGYAGNLGFAWIDESINFNLSLFILGSIFIFSILRMNHILSPIPLFRELYLVNKNFLKIIFRKVFTKSNSEIQQKTKLPIFNGKSQLVENESKNRFLT